MKRGAAGSPEKETRPGPPPAAGGRPTSGRRRGGPASGRLRRRGRGPFDLDERVWGTGTAGSRPAAEEGRREACVLAISRDLLRRRLLGSSNSRTGTEWKKLVRTLEFRQRISSFGFGAICLV